MTTASNHLLQLQKEIKEEEDEIFADLNSFINRSYLDDGLYTDEETSSDPSPPRPPKQQQQHQQHPPNQSQLKLLQQHQNQYQIDTHQSQPFSLNQHQQQKPLLSLPELHKQKSLHKSAPRLAHDRLKELVAEDGETTLEEEDDEDGYQADEHDDHGGSGSGGDGGLSQDHYEDHHDQSDSSIANHHHEPLFTQIPAATNHHHLHQELSPVFNDVSEMLDSPSYQEVQAVLQRITSNQPKPCVFFLEGNCRRSDCKYSHDLSNITCKYWLEGFCFKGDACPFMHSIGQLGDPNDPSSSDEDNSRRKELNPTFAIESEADFPSLPLDALPTALTDTTKASLNTADELNTNMKHHILSSNPAVVFKTVKKRRKKG